MATPITVAFHVKTKIAPAPYMNENTIAISSTVMLLKNMFVNLATSVFAVLDSVTFPVAPDISMNVSCCDLNSCISVPRGSTMYIIVVASTIPRNRYMNAFSAFQCSSRSILSGKSCRSFSSSYFIILYIMGVAPIATNATSTMLAYSGKNLFPIIAPSIVSISPKKISRYGFFSAFTGFSIDSSTIYKENYYKSLNTFLVLFFCFCLCLGVVHGCFI